MCAENDENMKSDERTTEEKSESYTNSPRKIILHNEGSIQNFAKL